MAKIIYSEIEDCLDCPFVRLKSKYGGAHCWLYDNSMVARTGREKPDFCKVESITVKLGKK
jgi:hypothetical protein